MAANDTGPAYRPQYRRPSPRHAAAVALLACPWLCRVWVGAGRGAVARGVCGLVLAVACRVLACCWCVPSQARRGERGVCDGWRGLAWPVAPWGEGGSIFWGEASAKTARQAFSQ